MSNIVPTFTGNGVVLYDNIANQRLLKAYRMYPSITYYWTGLLIMDHLYLVGNLTNSKSA
jgi:hypothetical protein